MSASRSLSGRENLYIFNKPVPVCAHFFLGRCVAVAIHHPAVCYCSMWPNKLHRFHAIMADTEVKGQEMAGRTEAACLGGNHGEQQQKLVIYHGWGRSFWKPAGFTLNGRVRGNYIYK